MNKVGIRKWNIFTFSLPMTLPQRFPDFEYDINLLSKFLASSAVITIMLKDKTIVHHTPKDKNAFIQWLTDHKIENIK